MRIQFKKNVGLDRIGLKQNFRRKQSAWGEKKYLAYKTSEKALHQRAQKNADGGRKDTQFLEKQFFFEKQEGFLFFSDSHILSRPVRRPHGPKRLISRFYALR